MMIKRHQNKNESIKNKEIEKHKMSKSNDSTLNKRQKKRMVEKMEKRFKISIEFVNVTDTYFIGHN